MKAGLAVLALSLCVLPGLPALQGAERAPPGPHADAVPAGVMPAAASSAALGPASGPQAVADGHQLFNDNCEHCHGPDAVTGIEERNLRHLALRYGAQMNQVFFYTVTHGRPTKGMPNWSGILTQAQFRNILAYLHSVQEH
jgi:polar amino acid transport system substrate-binding protein